MATKVGNCFNFLVAQLYFWNKTIKYSLRPGFFYDTPPSPSGSETSINLGLTLGYKKLLGDTLIWGLKFWGMYLKNINSRTTAGKYKSRQEK